MLVLALVCLAVLGSPRVAMAQDRPTSNPSDPMETYSIDANGIQLESLVSSCEKMTGKTFIYSEATGLKGKIVKILGTAQVPRSKMFSFFQAVFVTQGFALVPVFEDSNVLTIENIDGSRSLKQRAPFVPWEDLGKFRNEIGQVIMTSIPLKFINVANVRGAVSQILANRSAEFTQEVASANSLIVVAFAPTVFAIQQIIKAMDVPQISAQLKFEMIELHHAVAEELQPIVDNLIKADTSPGGGRPRAPSPEGGLALGADKPEPKIIGDPRTNTLIVYAVESDLNEIKRLVAALDAEVKDVDNRIHVYMLKNTKASDLEETLRQVINQGTGGRGATGGTRVRNTDGRGASSTSPTGQDVTIVADHTNNALIITASKTRYAEIISIVQDLDKRRPQVLVQAAIAELSDSDVDSIGVELAGFQGGSGDFRVGGLTGLGLSTIGFGGANASPSSVTRVPNAPAGGGAFGLFSDRLNIPLLVQLLKTRTKSNLVSVPSVLTNDNEQSTIEVGRSVATQTTNTTVAGADNTGFGGFQDAKVQLIISPHISNDNYLRIEVQVLVEAFVGVRLSATIPPDKTTRKLTGSVTVQSGRTVVIGGLIQDNDTETVSGVPFLMDIPLLGELFKRTDTTKERTTLYVFITPTIFSDFDGLSTVSDEKKMEVMRLDGQIKLIDPNFRPIMLDDKRIAIETIDASGNLDMPRYVPVTPHAAAPAESGQGTGDGPPSKAMGNVPTPPPPVTTGKK